MYFLLLWQVYASGAGSLTEGVALAADFVKDCIRRSEELQIPVENGVCFEELMGQLVRYKGK